MKFVKRLLAITSFLIGVGFTGMLAILFSSGNVEHASIEKIAGAVFGAAFFGIIIPGFLWLSSIND